MKSSEIVNLLNGELEHHDFECYPFNVDWYNHFVNEKYKLNYDANTLGVLILNGPRMFEKLFLSYLFDSFGHNLSGIDSLNDPIDSCLALKFASAKQVFFFLLLVVYKILSFII